MSNVNVKIDVPALVAWLAAQPESQADLAARIGKGANFFSRLKRSGEMRLLTYNLFVKTFNLPDDAFIKKELKPEPFVAPVQNGNYPHEHEDGYWLRLKYSPTNCKVQIMFKDEVIIGAASKIKGNTELDFAQAISYAAHMCYKFLEQKELESQTPIK